MHGIVVRGNDEILEDKDRVAIPFKKACVVCRWETTRASPTDS